MSRCKRCKYRCSDYEATREMLNSCSYLSYTGHSRLAQVYKQLGVKKLTPEAMRLLKPEHCPFFEAGERGRMPGTRPRVSNRRWDEGKALRLWQDGKCDREIAEAVGVSRAAIGNWRRRQGLAAHYERKTAGQHSRATETQQDRLRALWEQGLTDREIGEALSMKRKTVANWRKRLGLESKHWKRKVKAGGRLTAAPAEKDGGRGKPLPCGETGEQKEER